MRNQVVGGTRPIGVCAVAPLGQWEPRAGARVSAGSSRPRGSCFRRPKMNGARELKHLQKAKLKAQRSHNLREEANICNQLGEVLAKQGQFQKAIEEHRQELQLSEVLNDVIGCAVANRKIGECLAELGSYSDALEHQRKHLQLAQQVANHVEEQRAWATIGRTYLFIYETDQESESLQEAENAFQKSLAIVDNKLEGKVSQHELSEMRARLYLNLGFLCDNKKDPVRCNQYIRKSIYIAEQNKLYEDLYRANVNLGNIHCRNGEHAKAVRLLEAAKECARKMKEKFMESECFSSIGQVMLILGDFVAAKRSLRKAFKLGSQHQSDHDMVRRNLKNAVKGCRLEEALSELGKEEQQDALGLCEQLGDLCCKVCSYRKAIDYYQMQLRYAEQLEKPDRELAVIHVSLATTFSDLDDHEQALKHYQAELSLRTGNPKEECKTWLNVAMAKEECGRPYAELEECYQKALRCADQAEMPRLQARSMRLLHSVQQRNGRPEADITLGRLQQLSPGSESGDESDVGEVDNSEPLEDSELELSESDDEEMEGYDKSIPGRRKINRWNRRNEKGETVLHRACIEGNLKHVQCLVEKGHPLNPRDYCGWTPLHEACNHGHLEIVQFLLDHQANINDAGGPHCEGITPLHDAVISGNFAVAQLLVEKGASVTVQNAEGQTPLDSLHKWERDYRTDLDRDTRLQCRHLEKMLMSALARGEPHRPQLGQCFGESDLFDSESSQKNPLPASQDTDGRRAGRVTLTQSRSTQGYRHRGAQESRLHTGCSTQLSSQSRMGHSDSREVGSPAPPEGEGEEEVPMDRIHLVRKPQRAAVPTSLCDLGVAGGHGASGPELGRVSGDPSPAASTYQAAMRGLGSAKSRTLSQAVVDPPQISTNPPARPALVPDAEYPGDDWLEDDLGDRRRRKRLREHGGASPDVSPAELDSASEDELVSGSPAKSAPAGPGSRGGPAPQRKRRRQVRMTQMVERTVVGRTGRTASTSAERIPELSTPVAAPYNSTSSVPPMTQSVNTTVVPSIRVRVKVQECTFLIPVPHSTEEHTVSWLADQASQRYYQACGLLPKLTLQKEGALLDLQDPVIHVLQSNEEVLANVVSWDMPPLADRYKKACQSLGLGEDGLVLQACETQGNSSSFRLCGLSLGPKRLTPVLRALRQHTATRHLRLSGNRLTDSAAEELLGSLVTMPNLTLLDVSSNQITALGLRKLSEGAQRPGEPVFQNLQELDLSLNPLGEGSSQPLASLIAACPVLSTLRLQGCGLTTRFLQHHRLQLAEALKGALHLKTLCLSHNPLGAVGIELVLQSLPHHSLTHLELAAVGGACGDTLRVEHLVRYLSQDGCSLTHLNLSANRLTDDSLRDLSRCLLLCRSLLSLDLSANAGLTSGGVEMLLGAMRERNCAMHFLSVAGAPVHSSPLAEGIAPKLGELRLCSTRLSKCDKEGLTDSWRSSLGGQLQILCRLHKCLLKAVPSSQH
ncbi:tonsoku-like protein isoform X2 [Hypanus sabinus]|uniref:tonsoku-like protein isoform X2 n=1 Tax=Hypanus sabinus TaxID=79690 RepID=UPI0028C38F70|nr:tonsoku-like protein isoform X2 [Hypanus sabinus]